MAIRLRASARVRTLFAAASESFTRLRAPLIGVLVLAFTVLAALGLKRIREEVRSFPDLKVHPRALRPVSVPRWADDSLVRSLRQTSSLVPSFSILDPELRSSLDRCYRRDPWIREVTSVDRVFPNRLRVAARVRKAIATVEQNDPSSATGKAYVPVDVDVVRLPGSFPQPPQGRSPLTPVILGASSGNPPAPGRVWDDASIREGVAVALELYALYNSPIHEKVRIAAIDVANAEGRIEPSSSEIVLVTEDGKHVQWGRSTRSPAFGELTTARKIDHLRRILDSYPGLAGVEIAKVLFEQPYVVLEPLLSSPTLQGTRPDVKVAQSSAKPSG